jgi:15-cis-phytoene synthase
MSTELSASTSLSPDVRPNADDVRVCRAILARGSRSFSFASKVLPRRTRDPAAAVYAFCRVADDAVDLSPDPAREVERLGDRVARIHAGTPIDDPVDRALAAVVRAHGLPQTLLEGLLEGFLWDAEGREYDDLPALLEYCARVASVVGIIMTLLMGRRDRHVLARACDLGAAMQLTNIARDVGEDARRGRLYLPRAWLDDAGIDAAAWRESPAFTPAVGHVVQRLLEAADALYARAHAGISALPRDCRTSIEAAALIYADIGRVIRSHGYDSVSRRAHIGAWRKLALVGKALWTRRFTQVSHLRDAVLPQAAFLVDAVSPT